MNQLVVNFHLPKLKEEPVIGSSCCVVMAESIIKDELQTLNGIIDINADSEKGNLSVTLDTNCITIKAVAEYLDNMGYKSTAMKIEKFT